MKKVILCCALLVTVLPFTQCSRAPSPCGSQPEEGCPAPGFNLSDLDGHRISLEQFRGKIVMLDFWATWCGPCRLTMPVLENLAKEYPQDLTLLAINVAEPPELVRNYVKQQNISSTVLLDEEGKVGEVYGSDSIPMQVLIDKTGIVRKINVGYSPRLANLLRGAIERLRLSSF